LDGHQPIAVTAVLVSTDQHGQIARCPLYGQTANARLSEPMEVANAIAVLHQWQLRQHAQP
jgi:hypothetical protein